MDKTIKGRSILFKKGVAEVPKGQTKAIKALTANPQIKKDNKQAAKPAISLPTSDQVTSWISDHPYFKWNRALEDCGMKPGNASRMMKNGWKIPDEVLPKLVKILKQYGFRSISKQP